MPARQFSWGRLGSLSLRAAEWDGEGRRLRLAVDAVELHMKTIDLRPAPAQIVLIELAGSELPSPGANAAPPRVSIKMPEGVARVEVTMKSGQQAHLNLRVDDSRLRVFVLASRGPARPKLGMNLPRAGRLDVDNVNVTLHGPPPDGSKRATVSYVSCIDAGLHMQTGTGVGTVEISGQCNVDSRSGAITALKVAVGAKLKFVGEVRTLALSESRKDVQDASGLQGFILRSESSLRLRRLNRIRVNLEESATLEVENFKDCAVQGPGRLWVRRGGNGLMMIAPALTLNMDAHAQVSGATGKLKIEGARHSMLAAGVVSGSNERRRLFRGRSAMQPGYDLLDVLDETPTEGGSMQGASLLGVRLPVTRAGLRVISILAKDAGTVFPAIHSGLPGAPALSRNPSARGDGPLQAEFARALADLARAKGAPASTRTYLAACSYRMRQRTSGTIERCALWVYGLLGYGERAMPAFATFMVLAVAMASIQLIHGGAGWDPTLGGISRYLTTVVDWLVTPLHILRLTSPDSDDVGRFGTLGRLLVAAPFAVGVFAMRNYVKDDHRTRS